MSPKGERLGILLRIEMVIIVWVLFVVVGKTSPVQAGSTQSQELPLSSGEAQPLPQASSDGQDGSGSLFPYLDLDRGIVRSVQIEEAWVENAIYLNSANENDLSGGHGWELSAEIDFAFNAWLGGEIDFPVFLLTYPLGQGPAAFGPVTVGLRVVPFQTGTEVSRQAFILSFEVEGNWWGTPQFANFPGVGNSVTPEMLAAWRYHHIYFQGISGYTVPLGFGAVANTFLDASVGRTWQHVWATQVEIDSNSAVLTSTGQTVPGFSVIPELAYMPFGDIFLNEIGEGLSVYGHAGPQPTTYFMMEYEFHGL